ncbi:MAG: hypothetical protein ACREAQ_01850 [Nitrososphaera sp.]
MITWSLMTGAAGICGTAALLARLSSRQPPYSPERYWVLGMAALVPAWLIAFLGGIELPAPPNKPLFIFSSALPLLGIIVTDAVVRHLRHSGRDRRPVTYWLIGVAALLPGWVTSVTVLVVKAKTS